MRGVPSRKTWGRLAWLAAAVLAGAAAGAGAFAFLAKRSEPALAPFVAPSAPGAALPVVRVVALTKADGPVELEAAGQVRAWRSVVLRSPCPARVAWISANLAEGQVLLAGEVALRLDASGLELELARAQAELRRIGLERERQLLSDTHDRQMLDLRRGSQAVLEGELTTLAEVEKEDAGLLQERSRLKVKWLEEREEMKNLERNTSLHEKILAELTGRQKVMELQEAALLVEIARAEVRAPFGGRVARLAARVGERVVADQALFEVHDESRLEAALELPADTARQWLDLDGVDEAAEAKAGVPVRLSWGGGAGQAVGKVAAVREVDGGRVELAVPLEEASGLRRGAQVQARIPGRAATAAIRVHPRLRTAAGGLLLARPEADAWILEPCQPQWILVSGDLLLAGVPLKDGDLAVVDPPAGLEGRAVGVKVLEPFP